MEVERDIIYGFYGCGRWPSGTNQPTKAELPDPGLGRASLVPWQFDFSWEWNGMSSQLLLVILHDFSG